MHTYEATSTVSSMHASDDEFSTELRAWVAAEAVLGVPFVEFRRTQGKDVAGLFW